jgi:chromosomal replication initiation ATPase DnaA
VQQGLLPLSYGHSYGLYDFVVADCNQNAFSMLHMVVKNQLQDNFFCVFGEEGSGKTHLLRGIASEYNLVYQNSANINLNNSRDLLNNKSDIFLVDDADKITDDVWWFNTYNLAKESGKKLIISSCKPPSMWSITLADWRSRLATFVCVEILNPDDDTLKRVLSKMWNDKGISVDNVVLDYIAKRIDRNFASIKYWAKFIDMLSAQKKRSITLNMLQGVFV